MAVKVWAGSDGDWGTAGNWSPSGVPVSSDHVVFNAGSQSVTSSLNQSAVALASLTVTDDYTGDIATSSGSLQVDATAVRLSGGGDVYLDGTFTDVHVLDQPTTGDGCDLDGAITNLYWSAGNMTLASTLTVTAAYLVGLVGTVTIESSVTITDCWMTGGTVSAASAPVDLFISNGQFTLTGGSPTTVEVWGGTYKFQTSGTLTTGRVMGGTFDARDNINIGSAITNLYVGSATVRLDGGLGSPTVTNTFELNGASSVIVRNTGEAA